MGFSTPHTALDLEFTLRRCIHVCTEQTVLLKHFRVTIDHDVHVNKLFLPCPMTLFKVGCPEPDTLLAGID